METILRYFEMLRFIPKEPCSISTPELLKKLQDNDYKIDIRTDGISLATKHCA